MSALGECAWTARDLVEFIVTDELGSILGSYVTEDAAHARRNYLRAWGVDAWVVPVITGEVPPSARPIPSPVFHNDPGDETTHEEEPC